MIRKVLLVLSGMSVVASVLVFTGGSAFAQPPVASGFGSCKFTAGKGTFSPPLTPGGSASVTVEKITFTVSPSADCGSVVTSPPNTTINTLNLVTGSGTYVNNTGFANSCAALGADNVGTIKVKTKWGAAPPIASTKAKFMGNVGTITNSGPIRDITLTTPTTVTGSFGPGNTGGTVALATSIPVACPPVVTSFKITGSYTDYSN